MSDLFGGAFDGRRVFVTGHTGFKGSWLCLWLSMMGADVTGYALEPETEPNHYHLVDVSVRSIIGDIRDLPRLQRAMEEARPEIVIHMAAQPLVRLSYDAPVETFDVNVMGSVNLLQACRAVSGIRAVVNVTSDKCYENREWHWGYRENEAMGGHDPYSASKGCAELVTAAYRNSFFNVGEFGKSHETLVASARAGNVIGGGDWARDRLVPDIIRATMNNTAVQIRSPKAVRPWQHVLNPLSGYLELAWRLWQGKTEFTEPWNFGPGEDGVVNVYDFVHALQKGWDRIGIEVREDPNQPHEARLLKLDCSNALYRLGWKIPWNTPRSMERTVRWYRKYYEEGKIESVTDIEDFQSDAARVGAEWAAT